MNPAHATGHTVTFVHRAELRIITPFVKVAVAAHLAGGGGSVCLPATHTAGCAGLYIGASGDGFFVTPQMFSPLSRHTHRQTSTFAIIEMANSLPPAKGLTDFRVQMSTGKQGKTF